MVTKVLVFILIFAILNLVKEGFQFYRLLKLGLSSDMTTQRLWGIGLSIAYILTIIFTGIAL